MLKEDLLSENYKPISRNSHQLLYIQSTKQGLNIRILVFDSTITGQQNPPVDQTELDNSKDVYQIFISNKNNQNLRMLRILKGITGLINHLKSKMNWQLNTENNIFRIMYKKQQIRSFQIKKSQIFNFFNMHDILNMFKQKKKFQTNQISYILAKTIIMNQEEKQGKPKISRIDIQLNKKRRTQSVIKQKQRKQRGQQIEIEKKSQKKQQMARQEEADEKKAQMSIIKSPPPPKFLYSDSVGIESFYFSNAQIRKQRQEDELCVYGSTSIVYKDHFTINLKKLSKQEGRNPVIWIGFAALEQRTKHKNLDTMEKFVVMGDKKKIKNSKKILWKDLNEKFLERQFYQGDVITVKANRQSGAVSWTQISKNVQLGSCISELVSSSKSTLVPFIQLWKNGDIVEWMD